MIQSNYPTQPPHKYIHRGSNSTRYSFRSLSSGFRLGFPIFFSPAPRERIGATGTYIQTRTSANFSGPIVSCLLNFMPTFCLSEIFKPLSPQFKTKTQTKKFVEKYKFY
jgi:hypothetical protein